MMLRLLAVLGSPLPIRQGASARRQMPSRQVLTGAIRLSFAAYRLSLPITSANPENHGQKIA
ncbi:hypothetical protein [Mesorhizobium hawassense]|nr:hypothetical protein [Mesorhizobium hawassense]